MAGSSRSSRRAERGTLRRADGTLRRADGTLRRADGTLRRADGTLHRVDGTLHPRKELNHRTAGTTGVCRTGAGFRDPRESKLIFDRRFGGATFHLRTVLNCFELLRRNCGQESVEVRAPNGPSATCERFSIASNCFDAIAGRNPLKSELPTAPSATCERFS